MIAEQFRQGRWAWDAPGLTFGSMFESSPVAAGPVVSPAAAHVGPGSSQVEFPPWVVGLPPVVVVLIPEQCWQLNVLTAEADGFFGPQSAVVEDAEERDEAWPAGLLRADGFEQCSRLGGIDDNATVYLMCHLGRSPLEALDRVDAKQLQFDRVVER